MAQGHFPSFSEGLSLRVTPETLKSPSCTNFPSFSEGLSLRVVLAGVGFGGVSCRFPFLFGGTFIEGIVRPEEQPSTRVFPFLFGGTFIEGFSPESG